MTVLGIGTDIVRTARFAEILAKHPHRLARMQRRILHPAEIALNHPNPVQQLSSAWAAKEALYKSLSFADQKKCQFNQWQKIKASESFEMVCDTPRMDRVLISLSHDGEYTIAYALRQKKV